MLHSPLNVYDDSIYGQEVTVINELHSEQCVCIHTENMAVFPGEIIHVAAASRKAPPPPPKATRGKIFAFSACVGDGLLKR